MIVDIENYTIKEWVLFFYIYCFIGWCIESTAMSIYLRRPVNRGFMYGPFQPIYGFGAFIMLFTTIPVRHNIILTFIVGALASTILEIITGELMEALFHVRYWDYSSVPLNFHGYICLWTTLCWGALTVFQDYFLHEHVAEIVFKIPANIRLIIISVMSVIIIADFTLSFKEAMNFHVFMDKLMTLKLELSEKQKELADKQSELLEKPKELLNNTKGLMEKPLKYAAKPLSYAAKPLSYATKPFEFAGKQVSNIKNSESIEQLKASYVSLSERYNFLSDRFKAYSKRVIKAYPNISSKKYGHVLKDFYKKYNLQNLKNTIFDHIKIQISSRKSEENVT
nr:hypothetical protein [Lachnospiraceae bacterium]